MKILSIVKGLTDLIVSAGAGSLVGSVLANTITPESSKYVKVTRTVSAFFLAGMIGDMTGRYAVSSIEKFEEAVKNLKKSKDETSEEVLDISEVAIWDWWNHIVPEDVSLEGVTLFIQNEMESESYLTVKKLITFLGGEVRREDEDYGWRDTSDLYFRYSLEEGAYMIHLSIPEKL